MKRFNRVHSSFRNVIERTFGLLKMKWQILYKMPPVPHVKAKDDSSFGLLEMKWQIFYKMPPVTHVKAKDDSYGYYGLSQLYP